MKKEVVLVLLLLISLPLVTACESEKGGVEVDGECYECGELDNICPADFGAECNIVDPDCNLISKWFIGFFEWLKSVFKR